eukprot:CAMPEP_0176194218 /NCGR_PEP_ID=MMETSP0121_2-20121125/5888_1 /TAXON_ID=160619 /ORGANISM="Kryptoperidinium foliaceum, Strain CCMP 1326" /LENGTH=31 /DNA_ID= /DNA_START= /DNA_END= /DNA_ORIENTATION=
MPKSRHTDSQMRLCVKRLPHERRGRSKLAIE